MATDWLNEVQNEAKQKGETDQAAVLAVTATDDMSRDAPMSKGYTVPFNQYMLDLLEQCVDKKSKETGFKISKRQFLHMTLKQSLEDFIKK